MNLRLLIAWTVFHFTGQINVPDVKQLGIDIIIQSLFTAHQLIYMVQVDLMEGLPILTTGLMIRLILAISSSLDMNTGSGFRNSMMCTLMHLPDHKYVLVAYISGADGNHYKHRVAYVLTEQISSAKSEQCKVHSEHKAAFVSRLVCSLFHKVLLLCKGTEFTRIIRISVGRPLFLS